MSQHNSLTASDKVALARHPDRPGIKAFTEALFTDFFIQRGDYLSFEDQSILGGIALYKGVPVTVVGHCKGKGLSDNIQCNFGMPNPQGYRKAMRIMRAAEKFGRPVITFVDTPGAYPGLEAEENGQGSAIANCIATMSSLRVPVIAIISGEGGSGGALALGVANQVLMMENAVYSVLSPEGFASILWKDPSRAGQAADMMKLTAQDLLSLGVVDSIIPEPSGGAHLHLDETYRLLDRAISQALSSVCKLPNPAEHRFEKYRKMGSGFLLTSGKEPA